ncbi:MAG: hypothetical protein LQ338_003795 [Usnochroma carphineum]|nr:MAG: hypothetical protein LQ338_003795 [Usnochroma carphineum]
MSSPFSPRLSLLPSLESFDLNKPQHLPHLHFLQKRRVNETVIIRLKWGQTEYKGRLVSVDSYMNIQLSGTEEFVDGKSTGTLGQVLIRYDVLSVWFCLGLGWGGFWWIGEGEGEGREREGGSVKEGKRRGEREREKYDYG